MSNMLAVKSLKNGRFCETCGKVFDGPAKLAEHSRMHTGEKPFACALCLQSFSRRNHLLEHLRAHSGQRRFLCRLCGCAFAVSFALTRHERSHGNERPHRCDLCSANFSERHHLLKHRRLVHCNSVEESRISTSGTNECKYCGLQLKHRDSLHKHLRRMHQNEANLKCKRCDFRTHSEITLHRHSLNCDNDAEAANREAVCSPSVKLAGPKLEIKTDKRCGYSLEFRRNAARLAFELKSNWLAATRLGVTARQIRRWRQRKHVGKLSPRLSNQTDCLVSSGSSSATLSNLKTTSTEAQPTSFASFERSLPQPKSIHQQCPPTNGRGSQATSVNRFQAEICGLEQSDPIGDPAEAVDLAQSAIGLITIRAGTLSRPRNVVLSRGRVASRRGYGSGARKEPKQNAFRCISSSENGGTENSLEVAFKRIFAPEDAEPDPELASGFAQPSKRRHRFPPSLILCPAYALRTPFFVSPSITPLALTFEDRLSHSLETDEASDILVSVDGSEF